MRMVPRFLPPAALLLPASLGTSDAFAQTSTGPASAAEEAVVLTPPAQPAVGFERLSTLPPEDLSAFSGKPVLRSEVRLEGETWGNKILPTIQGVTPGTPFSAEVGRRALTEVLDTGRFAKGRVTVLPEGTGVVLRISVYARKVVDTVRTEIGGAKVDADELVRVAGLVDGGELIGSTLYEQIERMEIFLARRGYPKAAVNLRTEQTKDPLRVRVIVEVKPNEPRTIHRRVFYLSDPRAIDNEELRERHPFEVGAPADEIAIDLADATLQGHLRGKGFHDARVIHDVVSWKDATILRVRAELGARTEPKFEGNYHIDADALALALEVRPDANADTSPARFVEKIRTYYRERGFLDVEVSASFRDTSSPTVRHLVFKIVEHDRVTVLRRTYPCFDQRKTAGLEGGPKSITAIGAEIDSFLEEELPGADLLRNPDPRALSAIDGPSSTKRAEPVLLDPGRTYSPETYERALSHVRDLYRSEGFLHAEVGPLQVLRKTCDPKVLDRCSPLPYPTELASVCTVDGEGLPNDIAPLSEDFTCNPNASNNKRCEPLVSLRVPVRVGPRTILYDVAVIGAHIFDDAKIVRTAELAVGKPATMRSLEEARRRVLDAYKEEGYAFADVKVSLEESLDHTRARARFEIIEGEQVIVDRIVVKGCVLSSESLVRKRVALSIGKAYRLSDVRKTQDYLGALGLYGSIDVSLADPGVPQKYKTVYIQVAESQTAEWGTIEPQIGVRTGEGFRAAASYVNKMFLGGHLGAQLRGQVSYLPDFFIFDDQVKQNFDLLRRSPCPTDSNGVKLDSNCIGGEGLGELATVAWRLSGRIDVPNVGLGPKVSFGSDLTGFRSLQRDFTLRKFAATPTLTIRIAKPLLLNISQTAEFNKALVFTQSLDEFLKNSQANLDTQRLLRVPDGESLAFAQRVSLAWDRRDSPFNPHTGTYLSSGVEHVDWFKVDNATAQDTVRGHFIRLTQTVSGYLPLTKKITFAASFRFGLNFQLTGKSATYTDRLFFLGGYETMRGWNQDEFIPQDVLDRYECTSNFPTSQCLHAGDNSGIRGGNLLMNPKFELRLPLAGALETVAFLDIGNLWKDPSYPFQHGFAARAAVGSGIRLQTPVGPLVFDVGMKVNEALERFRFGEQRRRSRYVEQDLFVVSFSVGLF